MERDDARLFQSDARHDGEVLRNAIRRPRSGPRFLRWLHLRVHVRTAANSLLF